MLNCESSSDNIYFFPEMRRPTREVAVASWTPFSFYKVKYKESSENSQLMQFFQRYKDEFWNSSTLKTKEMFWPQK